MANEVQVFEMIGGLAGNEALLPVDFLTTQTLSIDGAASAAFNKSTTQVMIVSTTGCVVDFGTAPDGTGGPFPIVAGHPYRFAARYPMKVIAVTGTATAPAFSDTSSDSLPAGAATAANQTTIIGHVDGIETALTAANASLDAVEAKVTNGAGVSGSAAFTPAAASHAAGDCNGAATDFALAAPSGCRLLITDATLSIASATAEATAWRLYLYNATPPSAIADDGAFDFTVATDGAAFLGYIDLGTAVDLGGGQWVEVRAINKGVKLSGTTVFGYLVNLTTLTPAAVAHTVTLVGTPL